MCDLFKNYFLYFAITHYSQIISEYETKLAQRPSKMAADNYFIGILSVKGVTLINYLSKVINTTIKWVPELSTIIGDIILLYISACVCWCEYGSE